MITNEETASLLMAAVVGSVAITVLVLGLGYGAGVSTCESPEEVSYEQRD